MKITLTILSCVFLAACSNVSFRTNIDEQFIASNLGRNALYEFHSGQQAVENGAILLGSTEGMSCANTQQNRQGNTDFNWLKKQAIEGLKQDTLNLGANAYFVEQCKLFNHQGYDCEQAYICTGQAYDYQ